MKTELLSEMLQRIADFLADHEEWEAETIALQAFADGIREAEDEDPVMSQIRDAEGEERERLVDLLLSDERVEH